MDLESLSPMVPSDVFLFHVSGVCGSIRLQRNIRKMFFIDQINGKEQNKAVKI